jgi:hypothetical protein
MMSSAVNYNQHFSDASKVSSGSSLVSMDMYDSSNQLLDINNTQSPIVIVIPQKLSNPPPTAELNSGPMSTEDDRVDLYYFSTNVTTNDSALSIEIQPLDPKVQFLVLVRYKTYPALNSTGDVKRGWDYLQLSPASMANIGEPMIFEYHVFLQGFTLFQD